AGQFRDGPGADSGRWAELEDVGGTRIPLLAERVNELKKCRMWSIPLLAEEGWLRHQLKVAKPPKKRRRRARSASAIARSRNSGQLGEIFRPEQFRRTDHPGRAFSERIHFSLWRVHPSSARRGMRLCRAMGNRNLPETARTDTAARKRYAGCHRRFPID